MGRLPPHHHPGFGSRGWLAGGANGQFRSRAPQHRRRTGGVLRKSRASTGPLPAARFFTNHTLTAALGDVKAAGGALHIFGLLSDGGVHSHEDISTPCWKWRRNPGCARYSCTPSSTGAIRRPQRGLSAQRLQDKCAALGDGRIASIVGRYYAMDRDNRWDGSTGLRYADTGQGEFSAATSVAEVCRRPMRRDENDEFVKPTVIGEPCRMQDGDGSFS